MIDELKDSLEAKWAWLTVALGVVSGLIPEAQYAVGESLSLIGSAIDSGRSIVEGIGTQVAVLWIAFGRKLAEALGK